MDNEVEFFQTDLPDAERRANLDRKNGAILLIGALIARPDGCIFTQRRARTRRAYPGVWDNIGGHIEGNETLEQALAREMKEETGWSLKAVFGCFGRRTWRAPESPTLHVEYLMLCEARGDLDHPVLETEKIDQSGWISEKDIDMILENRVGPDREQQRMIYTHAFRLIREMPNSPCPK